MDIQKTALSIESYVGTFYAQTRIESALPLPQGKTAKKVLSTRSEVNVSGAVCLQGGVDVSGTIILSPVVEGEDGSFFAFDATADYTHRIKDAAIDASMEAHLSAQLFSCKCIADEGGLRLVAVVTLTAVVLKSESVNALSSLSGERSLQQKVADVERQKRSLVGAHSLKLRDEVHIPADSDILCCNGYARITEVAPDREGVAVSGVLTVNLLLILNDGGLKQQSFNLDFSDIVPGEPALDYSAAAAVTRLFARVEDSEEGLSEIDAAISISVYGIVRTVCPLLIDAYDLDGSFEVQKEEREGLRFCYTFTESPVINEQLTVPNHLPEVYTPLYGTALAAVTAVRREGDRLLVDGAVQLTVVFQCDGGLVHSFTEELPLALNLDCDCDLIVPAICVSGVRISGSGRALEAQVSLLFSGECYKRFSLCFASDLVHASPKEQRRGILLYFADDGETLFDVGKRFCIPVSEISECNPDVGEPLHDGDRLLLIK